MYVLAAYKQSKNDFHDAQITDQLLFKIRFKKSRLTQRRQAFNPRYQTP